MSDEEKKAIEYWKGYMKILHWNTQLASEHYIKVLLDLVEKQSKEIEELKDEYNIKLLSNVGIYQLGFNDGIKSVENKIKAKIEEVQDGTYDTKIVFQSLLEKE